MNVDMNNFKFSKIIKWISASRTMQLHKHE